MTRFLRWRMQSGISAFSRLPGLPMNPLPRFPKILGAAFVLGIVIALPLLAHAATLDTAPIADDAALSPRSRANLESHAGYGNIFLGTVLAIVREEHVSWGPEDYPNRVIYYAVKVEKTLRGEITGHIEIKYSGADVWSAETRGFGPLDVGARYLFSAGTRSEAGAYPVYAGLGVIFVKNDRVAEKLITELRCLIPPAEAREGQVEAQKTDNVAETHPDEAAPTISLKQERGQSGISIVVSGANFSTPLVLIKWDEDGYIGDARVRCDDTFRTRVTVPEAAESGAHTIAVYGAGLWFETTFIVSD